MSTTNQRFLALDVFRGMTICFMIIVNTSGSEQFSYSPLKHAAWHGFTPTDLVFPSFLFAVGNAMSFVMKKWDSLQQSQVLAKIFKRTLLIFLIGYLMYWFPFVTPDKDGHIILSPISHTRILGVLQRIALAYCIAALMLYYLKPNTTITIVILILLLYWPVMIWFGDPGDPLSMTGNLGSRFDQWMMGDNHLYHGEGLAFEPEGWLSTLPAVGNVVGGYLAGKFIQQKGKTYEGLAKLLLAGFCLLVIGYFWDLGFPINKKLWTSSFVVYTVGLDCIILAAVIYVIDFLGKTRWTSFFQVFGKNPLPIYIFSEIGVIILYVIHINNATLYNWSYSNIYQPIINPYFGSLLFAISWMLVCWVVGWILDRKKVYIRV